jgi:hypothetical protein
MRKNPLPLWLSAVGATFVVSGCLAAQAIADAPAAIRKALHERYPEVPIVDVKPSPLPGLFEVFTGTAIVYTDASGDHLVAGPLIDARTRHRPRPPQSPPPQRKWRRPAGPDP